MASSDDRESRNSFSSEAMSPQKKASWKQRLSSLPRVQLAEIERIIANLIEDGAFDQELEIASRHCDPRMVHRTITDQGRRKLQEVNCSETRCPKCPHGPFWFVFRSAGLSGTKIRFQSVPALPPWVIDAMGDDVRTPIAYEIRPNQSSD